MMYAVEMGPDAMICIQSFVKITQVDGEVIYRHTDSKVMSYAHLYFLRKLF
jgi:hypothetical protein